VSTESSSARCEEPPVNPGVEIKKGFSRNRQEDAHEFFRFVTDAFQNTALQGLPK
jgi:hypothetical protein